MLADYYVAFSYVHCTCVRKACGSYDSTPSKDGGPDEENNMSTVKLSLCTLTYLNVLSVVSNGVHTTSSPFVVPGTGICAVYQQVSVILLK